MIPTTIFGILCPTTEFKIVDDNGDHDEEEFEFYDLYTSEFDSRWYLIFVEMIAVAYAIMTARSMDLDWKMRAARVLPMFGIPILSTVIYSAFCAVDCNDQKTLERLHAERQAKIDELEERTNYYTTQQLIQRYDLDRAAKAAAATVLASKLGSDSGLKVYLGNESNINASLGNSSDVALGMNLVSRHRWGKAVMLSWCKVAGLQTGDRLILEAIALGVSQCLSSLMKHIVSMMLIAKKLLLRIRGSFSTRSSP